MVSPSSATIIPLPPAILLKLNVPSESISDSNALPDPRLVPLCRLVDKSADIISPLPLSVIVTFVPAVMVCNTSDDPVIEPS